MALAYKCDRCGRWLDGAPYATLLMPSGHYDACDLRCLEGMLLHERTVPEFHYRIVEDEEGD